MVYQQTTDPSPTPPAADDPNSPHEIGVPKGYTAHVKVPVNGPGSYGTQGPGTAPSAPLEIPARYFEGDDWQPAGWPPDQIAALQRALVVAGLIPKNASINLGYYDTATRNAYRELLTTANASGMDRTTALQTLMASPRLDLSGRNPRQPLVVKITNPDDLRAAFRDTVIKTLGQGWDSQKIDRMVSAYQQTESEAQQQQYAMTGSGSATDPGQGGTLTVPPSPDVYAATQARSENPELAQEHDTLGFVNQFRQLVGGWQGGG